MKRRTYSQLPLLAGLVIGVLALWIGTTPVTGTAATAIGGGATFTDHYIDSQWVAVRTYPCSKAQYRVWQDCSHYKPPDYPDVACDSGSYIWVAEGCSSSTGYDVAPSGPASCDGDDYDWCKDLYHASVN